MKRQKFPAELSAQIKQLWWDGMEADAIAAKFKIDSVDAVANHIHKKHYHRRPGWTPLRARKVGDERREHAKLIYEPQPKLRNGEPITFITVLVDECRWMHGDGVGAQLCAHRTIPGDSYCPHHAARAYNYDLSPTGLIREIARAALFRAGV